MGVMGPKKETEKANLDLNAKAKMEPEKQMTEATKIREETTGIDNFSKEPNIKTKPINWR